MSNTLFTGKVYHRFDELPSTNDRAASLLADGDPPEGTIVRADYQSAGRGQMGAQWWSRPGENLLLSIIYYPTWLEIGAQFYLNVSVALGVRDAIAKVLPASIPVLIKWPNDIYLGHKKTGGILIQNALSGMQIQSSVIGIGLNVNQSEFPDSLPHATSLSLMAGQAFDLDALAEKMFECLENRYLQLRTGNHAALHSEYESYLWRYGTPASYSRLRDGALLEATLIGVTSQGLLRLHTTEGEKRFDIKEIAFCHE
ncbi:MAG: biotin--[acetyl-CoA-carboxylase] ligase [Saprospiraceae bacterium]|nr:biotin--[acetyl-CoA-carboxylase] ligase [Saprospiraceae bacterium]